MKKTLPLKRKTSWLWRKLKVKAEQLYKFQIYQETRTRILLWYLILMGVFIAIAIPTIRYGLINDVNERVKADLREDLEAFEEELLGILLESSSESDSKLTKNQQTYRNISLAFDRFLATNQAEDDNYFIAIINGSFYKANAPLLAKEIAADSKLMQYWQELTVESRGEVKVDNPDVGSIIYKAEPIRTTEKVIGVFVVAHLSAGERLEVLGSFYTVVRVLLVAIAVASLLAWIAAGKVLAPLKGFSDTLQSISETDLSQRIPIEGDGELAKLGNTFNSMMERIEKAFATQRNFINDAGHELKTPVTIIRGHLELMCISTPEQQETIDLTLDELDRMNRLVEDLVLLAKAERPDFLQLEIIKLTTFVLEIFSKLQTLGQRDWHLDNHILSGIMIGDRQRITQAIINLANNAVQHTPVGSLIVFGAKLEANKVEFWLKDTGNGIAASEQDRIFNRFARVKDSRRVSEGSGLGLAIVKAVVEAHKGAINLQSTQGIGSTFTLIFPLEFTE